MWGWTDRVTLIEKGANLFLRLVVISGFLTPDKLYLFFRDRIVGLRAHFPRAHEWVQSGFSWWCHCLHCPLWTFPFAVVPTLCDTTWGCFPSDSSSLLEVGFPGKWTVGCSWEYNGFFGVTRVKGKRAGGDVKLWCQSDRLSASPKGSLRVKSSYQKSPMFHRNG